MHINNKGNDAPLSRARQILREMARVALGEQKVAGGELLAAVDQTARAFGVLSFTLPPTR